MTKHTIAGADTQACIFDFLKKILTKHLHKFHKT